MLLRLCAEPDALTDFLNMVGPEVVREQLTEWLFRRTVWCYDGSRTRREKLNEIRQVLEKRNERAAHLLLARLEREPLPALRGDDRLLPSAGDVEAWLAEARSEVHTAWTFPVGADARRVISDFVEHCEVRTVSDRYLFKNGLVPHAISWLTESPATSLEFRTAAVEHESHLRSRKNLRLAPDRARDAWSAAVGAVESRAAARVTLKMASFLDSATFHARTVHLGVPELGWRYSLFVDPGIDALVRPSDTRHARVGWSDAGRVHEEDGDVALTHVLSVSWSNPDGRPVTSVKVRRAGSWDRFDESDVDGNLWVRAVEDMLGTRTLEREW